MVNKKSDAETIRDEFFWEAQMCMLHQPEIEMPIGLARRNNTECFELQFNERRLHPC